MRIVSNPAFSRDAVAPQEAIALLETNLRHPDHRFWPDQLDLAKAVQPFAGKVAGHRQITDAYLLGLALQQKGKLVSLDRGVADLLPEKPAEKDLLVIL